MIFFCSYFINVRQRYSFKYITLALLTKKKAKRKLFREQKKNENNHHYYNKLCILYGQIWIRLFCIHVFNFFLSKAIKLFIYILYDFNFHFILLNSMSHTRIIFYIIFHVRYTYFVLLYKTFNVGISLLLLCSGIGILF